MPRSKMLSIFPIMAVLLLQISSWAGQPRLNPGEVFRDRLKNGK